MDVGLGPTDIQNYPLDLVRVLILVLVDVGLGRLVFDKTEKNNVQNVLILVLVDVGLGQSGRILP